MGHTCTQTTGSVNTKGTYSLQQLADLAGQVMEPIAGQVELHQRGDLAQRCGKLPQPVLRQVQAPQLRKPTQQEHELHAWATTIMCAPGQAGELCNTRSPPLQPGGSSTRLSPDAQ